MAVEAQGQSVDIAQRAVLKVLYHAAKFPAFPICGVLLGAASGRDVTVHDAVPLFHSSGMLSPCLETALTQVEAYASSKDATSVVGYYEGDARGTAVGELTPVGRAVAKRIAEACPGAVALALDNKAFGTKPLPLELWVQEKGSWRRGATAGTTGIAKLTCKGGAAGIPEMFQSGVEAGVHQKLADFDDHLDDIGADWTNASLEI